MPWTSARPSGRCYERFGGVHDPSRMTWMHVHTLTLRSAAAAAVLPDSFRRPELQAPGQKRHPSRPGTRPATVQLPE